MNINIEKIVLDRINLDKNIKLHLENDFEMTLSIQIGLNSKTTFNKPTISKINIIVKGKKDNSDDIVLKLDLVYLIFLTPTQDSKDEIFSLENFRNKIRQQLFKKLFSRVNRILIEAAIDPIPTPMEEDLIEQIPVLQK